MPSLETLERIAEEQFFYDPAQLAAPEPKP